MTAPRATLVVLRALGLGDLLTAVPALRALAEAFPEHRRLLAAPRALDPLVRLIDVPSCAGPAPRLAIHAVVDTTGLRPLPGAAGGADVAVNLHGRGPQSHRLLAASRPARTVAFRHPDVDWSAAGPEWAACEHETARWCRLLAESGIPADPARLEIRPPAGEPPPVARGATLIHPGAASAARRWPPERFAAVARRERERGRPVVVTGAAEEADLAAEVARAAGLSPKEVLAGRTDLGGLVRVVAAAGRVVCGDTGVAHLAAALATPSVVLFGPTPPSQWGPPPDRPWHRALWAGTTGNPHAQLPHPGLLEIDVADVERALESLPATRPRDTAAVGA